MTHKTNQPGPETTTPAKKKYETPELMTYGDIREITKAAGGMTGMNDGGGGPDKTGP